MRNYLVFFIIAVLISNISNGQELYSIREDNELNKEYLFKYGNDSLSCVLSFIQTDIAYDGNVYAKFMLIETNLKLNKTDTIIDKVNCNRISDILEEDSTGYAYNPKVCVCTLKEVEYSIEFEQTESDYITARFWQVDLNQSKVIRRFDLKRVLK